MAKGNSSPGIIFLNANHVHQEPVVKQRVQKNQDYVYFGLDNLFPQRMVHFYDNINVHRQLINKIKLFIAGKGFEFEGSDAKKAEQFISDATGGQPKKFLKKMASDIYTFNGSYINVLYNIGGDIATLNFTDFTTIRCGKLDLNRNKGNYFHSSDWAIATGKRNFNGTNAMYEPLQIPRYNPSLYKEKAAKKHGQIWLAEDSVGVNGKIFYPEPTYMAVTNWLDIAAKIANLHKNNLANGMVGGMHFHIYEDLSDEKKRKRVEADINSKFAGTNNAGNTVVTWSVGQGKKAEVTPLKNNNSHEMGKFIQDASNEEIVRAHDVPNILANNDTKVGLGGDATAIKAAMAFMQTSVIGPKQEIIEETIDMFLAQNKINATTKIISLTPFDFLDTSVEDEVTTPPPNNDGEPPKADE